MLQASDVAKLNQLRTHAEKNKFDADAIVAMAEAKQSSVAKTDSACRTFLSHGVVLIFSIEDFSKVEPIGDPNPFARRGWVRHASISRQVRRGHGLGVVFNVVPDLALVREIVKHLGFLEPLIFPSPDKAGPLIQHVLENYP